MESYDASESSYNPNDFEVGDIVMLDSGQKVIVSINKSEYNNKTKFFKIYKGNKKPLNHYITVNKISQLLRHFNNERDKMVEERKTLDTEWEKLNKEKRRSTRSSTSSPNVSFFNNLSIGDFEEEKPTKKTNHLRRL